MFVPKPNGDLRLVVDFRRLNDITVKNRYPLPNIEEMLDRLQGSTYFSKIDLKDAFYAIRMARGEEWKTAFRTRYGLYQFKVMPMGLTNAPASCQDMVNSILRDLLDNGVIAYMDDNLIYGGNTIDKHIKIVQDSSHRTTGRLWSGQSGSNTNYQQPTIQRLMDRPNAQTVSSSWSPRRVVRSPSANIVASSARSVRSTMT